MNKKYIVAAVIAVIVIVCAFIGGYVVKTHFTDKTVIEVPKTDAQTLLNTVPQLKNDKADAERLADTIQDTTKLAPVYQFYASDKAAGDMYAETFRKQNNGDYVVKTQEINKVVDSSSQAQQNQSGSVYDNKYYNVTMERKKAVSVGAAVIDSNPYYTMSYRNKRTTWTGYYDKRDGKTGASVSYEVWSK